MNDSLGRESLGADSDWELPSHYYLTLENAQRQVGKGWSKLLADIYHMLPEGGRVLQVKEKWGRLDISVVNTDMNGQLEDMAYNMSAHICEVCGKKGKTRPTGWVKTLCFSHYFPYMLKKLLTKLIVFSLEISERGKDG